LLKKFIYL